MSELKDKEHYVAVVDEFEPAKYKKWKWLWLVFIDKMKVVIKHKLLFFVLLPYLKKGKK
jgi:hypothetical protein